MKRFFLAIFVFTFTFELTPAFASAWLSLGEIEQGWKFTDLQVSRGQYEENFDDRIRVTIANPTNKRAKFSARLSFLDIGSSTVASSYIISEVFAPNERRTFVEHFSSGNANSAERAVKYVWHDVNIEIDQPAGPLRPAARQPQIQYLRAKDIENIFNRYMSDRPINLITRELGAPIDEEGDRIVWFKEMNALLYRMNRNSRAQTASLDSLTEIFVEMSQRDKRYTQMISEFEKIFSARPFVKDNNATGWDLWGGDWFFIIGKNNALSHNGEYAVTYMFSSTRP